MRSLFGLRFEMEVGAEAHLCEEGAHAFIDGEGVGVQDVGNAPCVYEVYWSDY